MSFKFKPINLKIKGYDYCKLYNETSDEDYEEEYVDLSDMPPLESDEGKVKEGKGLKTPNKLLTRLSILLAQIKAANNSYELKNKMRHILYLFCQHNKITKKFTAIYLSHYNHGRKSDCNKRSQTFYFHLIGLRMLIRIRIIKLNLSEKATNL